MIQDCSSLQAGIYLSSVDPLKENEILENERGVKSFLADIITAPDNYVIKAYERIGVAFQIKRTRLLTHSFYVISGVNNEYHTLSFYGTKIAFYSEGAWIMDADSDFSSYKMFIEGQNNWDVKEIATKRKIDTERTVSNILSKIDSDITYYYKDHIKNKAERDNCNTALMETLAEIK
jgi:hypothetical protein